MIVAHLGLQLNTLTTDAAFDIVKMGILLTYRIADRVKMGILMYRIAPKLFDP